MLRAAVTRVTAELSTPSGNANLSITAREGVLLQLADRMGRIGQGEASPLPGYSPDTTDECEAALIRLAKAPPAALDASAPVEPQLRARLGAIAQFPPAARFAVETALLDLHGQATRRPLHAILAELAGASPPDAVAPISVLLDGIDADQVVDHARAVVARGVRTLKLKIGRPGRFADELALLEDLRHALGPDVALRLDANGAFTIAEAPSRLAILSEVAPELIEEPCAGHLAEVAMMQAHKKERVPIAADESLQDPAAWDALVPALAAGAIRALVLKPTALGGLLTCVDLARRARAVAPGVATIVTHTFEGPVALAAACALALALPGPRLAAGLAHHGGLNAWPEVRIPALTDRAIVPTASAGLGLRAFRLEAR